MLFLGVYSLADMEVGGNYRRGRPIVKLRSDRQMATGLVDGSGVGLSGPDSGQNRALRRSESGSSITGATFLTFGLNAATI